MRTLLMICLAAMIAAPAARAQVDPAWQVRDWSEREREPEPEPEPELEPERLGRGWSEGEAAPILTSPLAIDEIPPEPDIADPDPAFAEEGSDDRGWGDYGDAAEAVAAETGATPSADVAPAAERAPWDEPAEPMATAPDEQRPAPAGEFEPPPAEPSPPPGAEDAPAPSPADGP